MSQAAVHPGGPVPTDSMRLVEFIRPASLVVALALGLLGASVMGDAIAAIALPGLSGQLGTQSTGGTVVVVALLQAMVLAPIAIRSRVGGWRLAVSLSGVYWLITWLLTVIEAVVYLGPILPEGFATWTGISQGLVSVVVGPMAVVLFGRGRAAEPRPEHPPLIDRDVTSAAWGLRLVGIAFVYIVAYVTAGIFIALGDPVLQEYYESIGMPAESTLLALQFARSIPWAVAAALILAVVDMRRRTAVFMVGLVFCVTMASLVLAPNPFMPPEVRSTHLVEIGTSNFVFGVAAAWIITRRSRRKKQPAAHG
jgi:hypothetical protein